MAIRFLDEKSESFFFLDDSGVRRSYKLIFGEEVDTRTAAAPSGAAWQTVRYRGRTGEIKRPALTTQRSLEMYFLDVGQGDAAFVVTPNNTKILVDGGLKDRALGFLIWKYRLNVPNRRVTIDHLFLSHADHDHVSGLIPILDHPDITVLNIWHNGIAVYNDANFNTALGRVTNGFLRTTHSALNEVGTRRRSNDFQAWLDAVGRSGANYNALDSTTGVHNVGDPDVSVEIVGPVRGNRDSPDWPPC